MLSSLAALSRIRTASAYECESLVERHRLWGRGLGWIDIHLLAAAKIEHVPLLTSDRRLKAAAQSLVIVCE